MKTLTNALRALANCKHDQTTSDSDDGTETCNACGAYATLSYSMKGEHRSSWTLPHLVEDVIKAAKVR